MGCLHVKGVGGASVVDMERDTSRSETDWGRKELGTSDRESLFYLNGATCDLINAYTTK